MSSYNEDSFENSSENNQAHNLKLSIDLNSVRNLAMSANVFATYQI
jgi:hypothetical protein